MYPSVQSMLAAELRDVLVSVCWTTGICTLKKRRGRREAGGTAMSAGSSTPRLESRKKEKAPTLKIDVPFLSVFFRRNI